jgi:hypothetical protein
MAVGKMRTFTRGLLQPETVPAHARVVVAKDISLQSIWLAFGGQASSLVAAYGATV